MEEGKEGERGGSVHIGTNSIAFRPESSENSHHFHHFHNHHNEEQKVDEEEAPDNKV